MNAKLPIIIAILFCASLSNGQDLIYNGDFEEYFDLPNGMTQWHLIKGWDNTNLNLGIPIGSTVDYYHNQGSGLAKPPFLERGTVSPFSGEAFVGIITYTSYDSYREYLSSMLVSPMVQGQCYEVSFWVSLGETKCQFAANNLGIRFSTQPINQEGEKNIEVSPQLEVKGIISNQAWRRASFVFQADSNYQYITLGNFRDTYETDHQNLIVHGYPFANYFIDKISVKPLDGLGYCDFDENKLSISGEINYCFGDTIFLTATNGTQYKWYNKYQPDSILSTDSILKIPVTKNMTITVESENVTRSIRIFVTEQAPQISFAQETVNIDESGSIDLSVFYPVATYLWNTGHTSSILSVNEAGLYWVEASNPCGVSRDTILVLSSRTEIFRICEAGTTELSAPVGSGGNYKWYRADDPNNILSNDSTLQIYVDKNDVIIFESTYKSKRITLVIEQSLPIAPFEETQIDFKNSSSAWLKVTNADAHQILWNTGSTSNQIQIQDNGIYWVELTNSCGTVRDSIDVCISDNLSVEGDKIICKGELIELCAYNDSIYRWYNMDYKDQVLSTESCFQQVFNQNTTLVLESHCNTKYVDIFVSDKPKLELEKDWHICQGESLEIDVYYPLTEYLWNTGSVHSSIEISEQGEYWVTLENKCGPVTDTIHVTFDECPCDVVFPNAFTPNGDGINDEFLPAYECNFRSFYMQIIDRWGQIVFETDNVEKGWDGTIRGKKPANIGYYACIGFYGDLKNKRFTTGVMLVR